MIGTQHEDAAAGGMSYPQINPSEPLLNFAVLDTAALDMLLPERDGASRNRVAEDRDLAGPGAPGFAAVRKRSGDRARLRTGVAVIEVIYRDVAIHEHSLLHQALTKYLGAEVHILLCRTWTLRNVVDALDQRAHAL